MVLAPDGLDLCCGHCGHDGELFADGTWWCPDCDPNPNIHDAFAVIKKTG